MIIKYENIEEIRPAKNNSDLLEIVLISGQSIYIDNNENQFCISLNEITVKDKTEYHLFIEY